MRYKKKIYTIRAMQWTGRNIDTLQAFIANMVPYQINNDGSLSIQTLEGMLTYPAGAVLVRGKKGEFYAMDRKTFENAWLINQPTNQQINKSTNPCKVNHIPCQTKLKSMVMVSQ